MKREDDNSTLYIGLDESNHGRYPEIIVAVSSLIKTDTNISKMDRRERMSEEELIRFLNNEQRNYAYLKAKKGQLTKNKHQLVEAAPCLIDKLITDHRREYTNIDSIAMLFDGELISRDTYKLLYCIKRIKCVGRGVAVSYEYYPKSTKNNYDYPKILVAADSLAHLLFRKHSFTDKIGAEKRMIRMTKLKR